MVHSPIPGPAAGRRAATYPAAGRNSARSAALCYVLQGAASPCRPPPLPRSRRVSLPPRDRAAKDFRQP